MISDSFADKPQFYPQCRERPLIDLNSLMVSTLEYQHSDISTPHPDVNIHTSLTYQL